jgi:hypothetical protein
MSFGISIKYLNSSGLASGQLSYAIVGHPIVKGTQTTQANITISGSAVDIQGAINGTQHYSVFTAQNGTVIQIINGTTIMAGNVASNTNQVLYDLYLPYGYTILLFQNSSFFQQANSSSVRIGSVSLSVTSFLPTRAYYGPYLPSQGPQGNYVVDLGLAQDATLYVPTYVSDTLEQSQGDSSTWEQFTFTLTNIAVA